MKFMKPKFHSVAPNFHFCVSFVSSQNSIRIFSLLSSISMQRSDFSCRICFVSLLYVKICNSNSLNIFDLLKFQNLFISPGCLFFYGNALSAHQLPHNPSMHHLDQSYFFCLKSNCKVFIEIGKKSSYYLGSTLLMAIVKNYRNVFSFFVVLSINAFVSFKSEISYLNNF
jgi:hypothetical protein